MPRERRDPAYKQVVSMLRAKPRTASLTVDLRVRKAKSTINATAMTVKMRYVTKGPANDLTSFLLSRLPCRQGCAEVTKQYPKTVASAYEWIRRAI
jgi:hypothetical protein